MNEACQQKWGPVLQFGKPTDQESGHDCPKWSRFWESGQQVVMNWLTA